MDSNTTCENSQVSAASCKFDPLVCCKCEPLYNVAIVDLRLPSSRRKRRTFVLNSTLIVFVEYSFSHVPLPYNKFHVSLKGCSQIIEIGTFING